MAHAARSGDAAAIADSAEQALDHVAETLFTRALSPTADELARTLAGMINHTILSGQPITAEARAKSDAVIANLVEQVRVVEPTWSLKTAEAVVRARVMWWGQPRVEGSAATRSR
jgi:hypothetical protein